MPPRVSGSFLGSSMSHRLLHYWAITALTALIYWPSLHAPFFHDDVPSLVDNPAIRGVWPPSRLMCLEGPRGITLAGRPLLALSFAANYAAGGTEPLGC